MVDSSLDSVNSVLSVLSSMSVDVASMSRSLATAVKTASVAQATAIIREGIQEKHSMAGMAGMGNMNDNAGMSGMKNDSMSGMSGMAGMAGMAGMHGMGNGHCKMTMMWNWGVIDSCFLAEGWHVKTKGQFAGTCIGVFLWAVVLVLLNLVRRKLDHFIRENSLRRELKARNATSVDEIGSRDSIPAEGGEINYDAQTNKNNAAEVNSAGIFKNATSNFTSTPCLNGELRYIKPSIPEQILRALLFGMEYAFTALLGLILMSFNGYVIISAILGIFLGFLILDWSSIPHDDSRSLARPACC